MIYPPPALTTVWELLLERASSDGALLSFWSLGEGGFPRLRAGGQRNQQGMGNDGMAQYGSCVVERTIIVCTLKCSVHRCERSCEYEWD